MKYITVFFFMIALLPFPCVAKDWSVIQNDGDFFLQHDTDNTLKLQIFSAGGLPHFEKTIPIQQNADIVLLEYYSGAAGTSSIISIYNAVIFNTKTQSSLGDFPYRYVFHDDRVIPQPQWDFYQDRIEIQDEESATSVSIPLR
jgi:hypothetical protein